MLETIKYGIDKINRSTGKDNNGDEMRLLRDRNQQRPGRNFQKNELKEQGANFRLADDVIVWHIKESK